MTSQAAATTPTTANPDGLGGTTATTRAPATGGGSTKRKLACTTAS